MLPCQLDICQETIFPNTWFFYVGFAIFFLFLTLSLLSPLSGFFFLPRWMDPLSPQIGNKLSSSLPLSSSLACSLVLCKYCSHRHTHTSILLLVLIVPAMCYQSLFLHSLSTEATSSGNTQATTSDAERLGACAGEANREHGEDRRSLAGSCSGDGRWWREH